MLFLIVSTLVKFAILALGFVMPLATFLTWMERRQSAYSQDRLGPWRASFFSIGGKPVRLFGLLHPIADAVKMLFKEPFTPALADKKLHAVAPLIGYVTALAALAVVPFGPDLPTSAVPFVSDETLAKFPSVALQVAKLDAGILLVFALSSLGVYGAAIAGWASNNRFALLGGIRASAQAISYEIALGLTVVGVLLAYGATETSALVAAQNQTGVFGLPMWGLFVQPLAAVLFLVAAIAETKRGPFDMPEGESEIIGYFVEYSSMGFGMFMLGEFVEIVVLAAVFTTVFLGGWQLPWVIGDSSIYLGFTLLTPETMGAAAFAWLKVVLGMAVFGAKVFFLCALQLQLRWTLPRFRYDQVMMLGWKGLLPLALINIVVTAAAVWADPSLGLLTWVGLAMVVAFVLVVIAGPRQGAAPAAHGHA